MDQIELVNEMQVVELAASTRHAAIRALVQAVDLTGQGVSLNDLLDAIEQREATAHTILADGFAVPHAVIEWEGDYRIVLGRSKAGVDYEVPETGRVHLIVLFVVGRERQSEFHVQLLGALAELLESEEFRGQIVASPNTDTIRQLLQAKVGLKPEGRPRRAASRTPRPIRAWRCR